MMSKRSLNKKRIWSFLGFTLKKQTPITLLSLAFCLLICPGTIIDQIFSHAALRRALNLEFLGYSLAVFIFGIAVMLLLTILNFNFLFQKKAGDLFHAVPLTRNEIAFSRTFASFLGGFFTMSISYFCLAFINFMPGVKGVDFLTVIMTYLFMVLALAMLTLYTSVFAVVSGGVLDFIIALGAVNLGIPAVLAIGLNFFENLAYGVQLTSTSGFFIWTSPYVLGVLLVLGVCDEGASEAFKHFFKPVANFNWLSCIALLMYIVLSVLLVSYLIRRRKSEYAGEAYAFGIVAHILSVLVAFVGGYGIALIFTGLGFFSAAFWFFFIVGIVLVSLAVGAIFSRGFKTVKLSLIRAAGTVGVAIITCIALVFCASWAEERIPDENSIESVSVGYRNNAVFNDDFDIVIAIHKQALIDKETNPINNTTNNGYVDEKYTYPNKYTIVDSIDAIVITYQMKSGAKIKRSYYNLTAPEFDPLFIRYMQTEEYVARYLDFEGMNAIIDVDYEIYEENNTMVPIKTHRADIGSERAMEILSTYAEELLSADESAFYEKCDVINLSGINNNYYSESLRVPKSFKKTLAAIEKIEFEE